MAVDDLTTSEESESGMKTLLIIAVSFYYLILCLFTIFVFTHEYKNGLTPQDV